MTVFVDTSAIFALLIAEDRKHAQAVRTWEVELSADVRLITTNYVVAETYDLVRRRFGMVALRNADELIRGYFEVVFVSREQHERARAHHLARNKRDLSLVDCASFTIARDEGASKVFAYDRHFEQKNFELL